VYFPYTSSSAGAEFFTFIVRAPANQQAAVTEHVRSALRDLDAGLPILEIATMEQRLSEAVGRERLLLTLASVFASCACLLAAVGVYGTTTYWIARRRRELGIRMALGATSRAIMSLVVGRSLRIGLMGGCMGFALSLAVGRIIQSLLFQTQVSDVAVLLTAVGTLVGLILISCMVPVFSAVRTDPAIVLRSE
jgi:putative ABC transport system permease protein